MELENCTLNSPRLSALALFWMRSSPGALPQAEREYCAFGAKTIPQTFRRAIGGSAALTPRQHRSWKRRTSSALIAPLPPGFVGRLRLGYRAETPSVPYPHKAPSSEAGTCARRATTAPGQRLAWDLRSRRVGSEPGSSSVNQASRRVAR